MNLPNSLISIGESAFSNCDNLNTIIVGNSIKEIGQNAFFSNNETSLIDVYYRGSEEEWNKIDIQDETLKSENVIVHFNYVE